MLNPVSLIPNQTNITSNTYFFLEANISTLNVNNLSTGNITCANISANQILANSLSTNNLYAPTAYISSFLTDFISSANGEINELTTSTISTTQLDLDGQTLNATATELLLNGIPLATTSNLSSIAEWSYDPAISTVNMNNNDLINANKISTQTIYANTINTINLAAFNIFAFSTYTSTISSLAEVADFGFIDNLSSGIAYIGSLSSVSADTKAANISSLQVNTANASTINTDVLSTGSLLVSTISPNTINASTINTDVLSTGSLLVSTVAFNTLSTATIDAQVANVSTVNTNFLSTASLLVSTASFNTVSTNNLQTTTINGQPVPVSAQNWSAYPATQQVVLNNNSIYSGSNAADDVTLIGERFVKATGEGVYINADNGLGIANSLIQLSTTNGYRGEIDMIANDGNVLGGKITMTAKGADILGLLYGGVIELTAETGGGFIPSPAFTSAIRLSAASILEYSGATNSIGSVAGYGFYHGDVGLNLTAGVPPLAPNDPLTVYLYGTNGVLVYSPMYVNGPIRPYSDLTNNPKDLYIEAYNNLITTGYIQLRGVSTQTFYGGDSAILGLNRLQFSSIAGALENVSSLNGQPISFYTPGAISTVSTFESLFTSTFNTSTINGLPIEDFYSPSSISSLNEWAYFPALSSITLDQAIPNVVQSLNSTMQLIGVSTINDLPIASYIPPFSISTVETWATTPAISTIAFSSGVAAVVQSANFNTDNIAIVGSNINLIGAFTDAKNLLLVSTVSTAVIQGANDNLFGIGLQGLKVEASNIFLSTTQTNITGLINSSTITANLHTGRAVEVSTITASTISLGQQGSYGLSSLMYVSTAQIPGTGTSTTTYLNTDLSLLQNDLYCQQLRVGYANTGGSALSEIIMYAPTVGGTTIALNVGNNDRTFRVQSTVNAGNGGYMLDTLLNPPFFSTINQSTAMMAYFPSTVLNTIGVSTISFMPPKVVAGTFISLSTQNLVANTPLALWNEVTDFATGGITTSTTAIVLPTNGVYEFTTSIQFTKAGGAGTADWWFRKNGVNMPNTASEIYLPPGGSGQALGNITLSSRFNAGDKVEIMIASTDSGVAATFLQSTVTTPYTRPAVPSVITGVKCLNY